MRLDAKSRAKGKLGYEDVPVPDSGQIQTPTPGAMYSRKLNREVLTPLKQCKRNLEHRQVLLDRIEKLSKVYEQQVARKRKMAGLVQNEDFFRKYFDCQYRIFLLLLTMLYSNPAWEFDIQVYARSI